MIKILFKTTAVLWGWFQLKKGDGRKVEDRYLSKPYVNLSEWMDTFFSGEHYKVVRINARECGARFSGKWLAEDYWIGVFESSGKEGVRKVKKGRKKSARWMLRSQKPIKDI